MRILLFFQFFFLRSGTLHLSSFLMNVLTDRDFAYSALFTCEAHLFDLVWLRRLLKHLSLILARFLQGILIRIAMVWIVIFFVYRKHFCSRCLIGSQHWVPVLVRTDCHIESTFAWILRLLVVFLRVQQDPIHFLKFISDVFLDNSRGRRLQMLFRS